MVAHHGPGERLTVADHLYPSVVGFLKTDCFLVSDLNFNIMHASCAFFFEKGGGDAKFRDKKYIL